MQESEQPVGVNARAFARDVRRQLIFPIRVLVERQLGENRFLPDLNAVATHAIVFLDNPPAVLYGFAAIIRSEEHA
jgi:hypothetical protein